MISGDHKKKKIDCLYKIRTERGIQTAQVIRDANEKLTTTMLTMGFSNLKTTICVNYFQTSALVSCH